MEAYKSLHKLWELMQAYGSLCKLMEAYGSLWKFSGAYGSFGYFLKSGLRFSRNARPPSCASSSM